MVLNTYLRFKALPSSIKQVFVLKKQRATPAEHIRRIF